MPSEVLGNEARKLGTLQVIVHHIKTFTAFIYLTMLEAVKKKILLTGIFLVFASVLIAIVIPSENEEVFLKTLVMWMLRASFVFILIQSVFVGGLLIPDDVERKRVYYVLTKPVMRISYLLGRVVGNWLLVALSSFMLMVIAALVFWAFSAARGKNSIPFTEKIHCSAVDGGILKKVEVESDAAIRACDVNHELILHFRGLPSNRLDPVFPVFIRASSSPYEPGEIFRLESKILVQPMTAAGDRSFSMPYESKYSISEWSKIMIPKTVVSPDGSFAVALRGIEDEYIFIRTNEEFAYAEVPGSSPFVSIVLSFIPIALLGIAFVTAAVGFSSFVGGPSAIFIGLSYFVVSVLHVFMAEGLEIVSYQLKEAEKPGIHSHMRDERIPEWLLRVSEVTTRAALSVIPNLEKYETYTEPAFFRTPEWQNFGRLVSYTLIRILPFVIIGAVGIFLRQLS